MSLVLFKVRASKWKDMVNWLAYCIEKKNNLCFFFFFYLILLCFILFTQVQKLMKTLI